LNKQSQTADNGSSFSLGVGQEANNSSLLRKAYEILQGASELDGFFGMT